MKKGDLDVTLSSLRQDTINVPKLTLKGIDVSIEQTSGGANYQTILDNVKKNKGSAPPSSAPEKRLVIGDLVIENTTIHVDLQGAPGLLGKVVNPNTSITLPIDRIELHNVARPARAWAARASPPASSRASSSRPSWPLPSRRARA